MAGIASMMMTMSARKTAIKVLANHSERTIDESSWRRNCLDLFKVMRAAQNLYLVLEQTNEAMLRVAVEVITDMKARKMLWWNDSWYSDEEKREHFKVVVAEKLDKVLGWLNGEDRSSGDVGETMSATELANLKMRIGEAENAREAAEKQQHISEMVCRDMENRLKDAQDKIASLEKAGGTAHPRRGAGSTGSIGPVEAELHKKVSAGEARIQELEKNLSAAMRELHQSREAARRGKELGPLEKELAQAKKRLADQDALLEKLKSQTGKKEDTPPRKGSGASTGSGPRDAAAISKELTDRMSAMKVQHAEEMEAQRARLQAEIDKYKAKFSAMGGGGQVQGDKPSTAGEGAPGTHFVGGLTAKEVENLKAELANALKELESTVAKLQKKEQQLASAREENAELHDQKTRMLKTLNQLREQLRKVSDIATRKGCAETVQEIMDEAGLTVTLHSTEMRCFQRLYEDALRRMEKAKKAEQMLHVNQAVAAEANTKTATLQQLVYQPPLQHTATFSQMVWTEPQGAPIAEPPLAVLEGSELLPVQPWSMPPTPSLGQRQSSPRTPKTRRTSFPTVYGESLPPPAGVFGRTWREGTTSVERLPVGIPTAASLDCAPTSAQSPHVMPFSEVPPGSTVPAGNFQHEVVVGQPLHRRPEKRLEAMHSGLLPDMSIWANDPEPPYVQAPVKASDPRKIQHQPLRLPLSASAAPTPAPSPSGSAGLQAIVQGTPLGERPATSPLAEASLTLPAAEVHSPMSDMGSAGKRRQRGSLYRNPMLQLDGQAQSPSASLLVCRSLCEASMESLGPPPDSSGGGSMPSRPLRPAHNALNKSASDVSLLRPGIDVNIHIETLAGSGKLARLMSSGEPGGDLGLHVESVGGAGKLGKLILGAEASPGDETGAGKVARPNKGRLKGWKISPLQALSSSQPQLPHAVGRLHAVQMGNEPRAVSRGRKEGAAVTLPPACGLSLLTIEGMGAEVSGGKELLDVA